jgi:hypothetical protein
MQAFMISMLLILLSYEHHYYEVKSDILEANFDKTEILEMNTGQKK